jgi:hypothetical protein
MGQWIFFHGGENPWIGRVIRLEKGKGQRVQVNFYSKGEAAAGMQTWANKRVNKYVPLSSLTSDSCTILASDLFKYDMSLRVYVCDPATVPNIRKRPRSAAHEEKEDVDEDGGEDDDINNEDEAEAEQEEQEEQDEEEEESTGPKKRGALWQKQLAPYNHGGKSEGKRESSMGLEESVSQRSSGRAKKNVERLDPWLETQLSLALAASLEAEGQPHAPPVSPPTKKTVPKERWSPLTPMSQSTPLRKGVSPLSSDTASTPSPSQENHSQFAPIAQEPQLPAGKKSRIASAYIRFCSWKRAESDEKIASHALGQVWHAASDAEKRPFVQAYEEEVRTGKKSKPRVKASMVPPSEQQYSDEDEEWAGSSSSSSSSSRPKAKQARAAKQAKAAKTERAYEEEATEESEAVQEVGHKPNTRKVEHTETRFIGVRYEGKSMRWNAKIELPLAKMDRPTTLMGPGYGLSPRSSSAGGSSAGGSSGGGRELFLGWYDSSVEAALAYDEMACRLFGPHAETNFVLRAGTLPMFGLGLLPSNCTYASEAHWAGLQTQAKDEEVRIERGQREAERKKASMLAMKAATSSFRFSDFQLEMEAKAVAEEEDSR